MKINIYEKQIANGRKSLYLDYMFQGKRVRESLGLHLSGKKRATDADKDAKEMAEKIRSKREYEINSGMHGFISRESTNKDFVEYFRLATKAEVEAYESGKKAAKTFHTYRSTLKHLEKFTGGKLRFSAVTVQWLESIRAYFLDTLGSQTTAATYFSKIRAAINNAYKEGIIHVNPVKKVKTIPKIESEKVFLLEEELELLVSAPCPKPEWKQAFLFCCFTGLRLSDMLNLTWGKIQGDRIHFRQKKTEGFEYLPLNQNAKDILNSIYDNLDSQPQPTDKVFNLKDEGRRNDYIRQWAENAGIYKHLTYHSSRHTFATLLLTKGVDLYTVSKLLGHYDITTTLIYAKVIDKVKDNAINALPVFDMAKSGVV